MKVSNSEVNTFKYKLVRKEGNIVKYGNVVSYISWKKNGSFQAVSDYPAEGYSFALDLEVGVKASHISGQILKILENSKDRIKFEALDGMYEISYVDNAVTPKDKVEEVKPLEKLPKTK